MKRAIQDFVDRLAGTNRGAPEGAFRANPMSMLCASKYCPAWDTGFCRLHRGTKESA